MTMRQPHEGQRQSIWEATAESLRYPPLKASARTGVCVVGAGIAGLSAAYQLAKAGAPVIVLDDGPVGGGESGRTTAQITCVLDKGYAETARLRGAEGARLAAESHSAAIDTIERIVRDERIDCDFMRVDGYLFLADGDSRATLEEELGAAHRAGLTDVELIGRIPVAGMPARPALRFPRQGQFHVLRYLHGLSRAIERMGGRIHSGSHVVRSHGGAPARFELADGLEVLADAGILATNVPINDAIGYSSRLSSSMTYAIGLRTPPGAVTPMVAFDTAEPYHYIRTQPAGDHDVLIVGGEDHPTGKPGDQAAPFAALERWARAVFPVAGAVEYRWSGQVRNSFDGLAMIGPDIASPNIYVSTGNTGIGMTHSTIAGLLLSDIITGRPNPWAALYDPARLPPSAVGKAVEEGVNTLAGIKEWLTFSPLSSADQIPPDSGGVIGWGLAKQAVYRDPQGALHRYSALCAHNGCILSWNNIEKTWDCPCHGSRYDARGHVIDGPAKHDMSPQE